MATKLPPVPFDGQVFIDAQRMKWRWSTQLQIWCRVGPADTIPLADADTIGLLSAKDKVLIDSVPEAGGGFGIIVSPQLMTVSPDNPTGVIMGDIEFCSESLTIECVQSSGIASGVVLESGQDCGVCDVVDDDGNLLAPGMRFSASQLFLDTFCLEVVGPPGPRGLKGEVGKSGVHGFSDSPKGETGDPGRDAISTHTFSGITTIELDDIRDEAVVAIELDDLLGTLSYTKSKMNVPESDEPADQLVVTPISRTLFYPLLGDNPEEYVKLDDWRLSVPSGDPLPDNPDVLLAKIPNDAREGDEVEIETVRLTEFVRGVVEFYTEKLIEYDELWVLEIKKFIESKDAAARTILGDIAMRVAECEFQRPLQFCVGIKCEDCCAPPESSPALFCKTVIIAIYDTSSSSGAYTSDSADPPFEEDLQSWSSLMQTYTGTAAIRGGLLQPAPTGGGATGGLDELVPIGYMLPPDTDRDQITYKNVPSKPSRLDEDDIVNMFNIITNNGAFNPTLLVFVRDNSASLTTASYQAAFDAAKETILESHSDLVILEQVDDDPPPDWLGAMQRALEQVILTGDL